LQIYLLPFQFKVTDIHLVKKTLASPLLFKVNLEVGTEMILAVSPPN